MIDFNSPAWQTGDPPHEGTYLVRACIRAIDYQFTTFADCGEFGAWFFYMSEIPEGVEVLGWWPIPDKEETEI